MWQAKSFLISNVSVKRENVFLMGVVEAFI